MWWRFTQAQDQKARNGARQGQVQQAYEMWQKAIAGKDVAEKTYARISRLFESGVVAEQKLDEARAQYEAMKATEADAQSQYEMARNGARQEDKLAAEAQVRRAQGAVSEVNSYLSETVLTASADGEVTEIFPEVGELVGTGRCIFLCCLSALPASGAGVRRQVWTGQSSRAEGLVTKRIPWHFIGKRLLVREE